MSQRKVGTNLLKHRAGFKAVWSLVRHANYLTCNAEVRMKNPWVRDTVVETNKKFIEKYAIDLMENS